MKYENSHCFSVIVVGSNESLLGLDPVCLLLVRVERETRRWNET